MCKYCEDCKGYSPNGYREFTSNGVAKIIFDPEDVGFRLQVPDGRTYSITHCPWCGRELELQDDEAGSSAEDEIAKLERRIEHTDNMLRQLLDNVQAVAGSNNYDLRTQVIRNLESMKGKI